MSEDGEGYCRSCSYVDLPTEGYRVRGEVRQLCRLCAGAIPAYGQAEDQRYVLTTIVHCANAILDQLGAFAEWRETHERIGEENV